MGKYPYFDKKGRPSKSEQYVCLKINDFINDGKISEQDIDDWLASNGFPHNLDGLKKMFSSLTKEDIQVPKNKYFTSKLTKNSLGSKSKTKEDCIADAKKYKTKKEWRENSITICNYAYKKGWFDECTAHMDEVIFRKIVKTKEDCIAHARKYKTKKEWRANNRAICNYAYKKGWFDECTAHMDKLKIKYSPSTKNNLQTKKNKQLKGSGYSEPNIVESISKSDIPKKYKEPILTKSEVYFDIIKNGKHVISIYFSDDEKSTNWLLKSISEAFVIEVSNTNKGSVVNTSTTSETNVLNNENSISNLKKPKSIFKVKSCLKRCVQKMCSKV